MISTIDDLEAIVGKKSPSLDLKVLDFIDPLAAHWIACSTLMLGCVGHEGRVTPAIAGGAPGFAMGDQRELTMPLDHFDPCDDLVEGVSFGSLWLVPSMRESLRVNGRISQISEGVVKVEVIECYLHCAKALIRSDFWQAEVKEYPGGTSEGIVARTRFMAFATVGATGHADVSPKGDPAGRLMRTVDDEIHLADRPGNKRTDSFRNILEQPLVAAILIEPGCDQITTLRGRASLSSDAGLCAPFEVQGNAPKLVVRLASLDMQTAQSNALRRAVLWPASKAPADLDPAKIFAGHMRASRQKGVSASIARTIVSIPGFLRRGLEKDYEDNLY